MSSTGYRSFFWPGVLVLVGVIALLVNTGVIPADRLYELVNLWPVLLIVIGIEIIVRRSLAGTVAVAVSLAVIVVAVAGAAAYLTYAPSASQTRVLDTSAPLGSLSSASLEIDVGGATLKVTSRVAAGDDLYHAHIEYTGREPSVELDRASGRLKITQRSAAFPALQNGRFTMELDLNPSIPWSIVENSGAVAETMDVPDLKLRSLAINTGASREEITVGPPSGVVGIHVNGGALTVNVHRAPGADASIHVSGGAVTLTADGHTYHAIGSADYETTSQGADRYEIEVNGGAATVTLDSSGFGPAPQS